MNDIIYPVLTFQPIMMCIPVVCAYMIYLPDRTYTTGTTYVVFYHIIMIHRAQAAGGGGLISTPVFTKHIGIYLILYCCECIYI